MRFLFIVCFIHFQPKPIDVVGMDTFEWIGRRYFGLAAQQQDCPNQNQSVLWQNDSCHTHT